MNSRDIILANINHEQTPRCGMTFDRGRYNDMLGCGLSPYGYEQKRWFEGEVEYYDDAWGNLWVRMRDGSIEYRVKLSCLDEIARWVIGFGGKAKVVKPAELRRQVLGLAQEVMDGDTAK